jgi:hypothetical protein
VETEFANFFLFKFDDRSSFALIENFLNKNRAKNQAKDLELKNSNLELAEMTTRTNDKSLGNRSSIQIKPLQTLPAR